MAETMDSYLDAYNAGAYVDALDFMDAGAVVRACGSQSDYAAALRANFEIEMLEYLFLRVDDGVADGEASATADIYFHSFDVSTGQQVDFELGAGLLFSKSGERWLLADPFPIGVTAFCG
jgi:hypothetical protein